MQQGFKFIMCDVATEQQPLFMRLGLRIFIHHTSIWDVFLGFFCICICAYNETLLIGHSVQYGQRNLEYKDLQLPLFTPIFLL